MPLARIVQDRRIALAEGAVIERLRRDPDITLDPHVLHAGFVTGHAGQARRRVVLERIYRGYVDAARQYGQPAVCLSPTWRASPARVAAAGLSSVRDLNRAGVDFLLRLRETYAAAPDDILIGGLMGCAGDAYDPRGALAPEAAARYHREQAAVLAESGVDFLLAATLPAACEARGMARAMAASGCAYLLSFVVRPHGALLDGTAFEAVIQQIDTETRPAPLGYMVNCVHPSVFASAMHAVLARDPAVRDRVIGLQANTSRRSPEELDGRAALDAEDPESFAAAMLAVQEAFGLCVLGGCCGSDDRHMRSVAARVAAASDPERGRA